MTQSLESIIAETAAKNHLGQIAKSPDSAAESAELVEGEHNRTTFLALAEWYDRKRDRAIVQVFTLANRYTEFMDKEEVTSAHPVVPSIQEMKAAVERALEADKLAAKYRKNTAR